MPYRRFAAASVTGSALWAVVLCLAGYVFFDSLGLVADVVTGVGLVVAGVVALVAAVLIVRARAASARRRSS
jgi:membrane protein DedA with SNARE-associated domain